MVEEDEEEYEEEKTRFHHLFLPAQECTIPSSSFLILDFWSFSFIPTLK